MKQYKKLVKTILKEGIEKEDRTGTGTLSIFGYQMRFKLSDGFPLVTTKKVHLKSIIHELLWFIKGDTNTKYLNENGVRIWDAWALDNGELGKIYGHQWRKSQGVDQITQVINGIKENPNDRGLIVSAWNVGELEEMALRPCHTMFQFYVVGNKLSLQLYQRSADVFLGLPFNIASYSLLLIMVAQVTNLVPHEFIHTIGDAHIYKNHIPQMKKQLKRKPYPLPVMNINKSVTNIDDFKYNDFDLLHYHFHPSLKGKVAV